MARNTSSSWPLLHHGLVSAVLGFPLAIWLSGLLVYHLTSGHDDPAKYQVAMWSVVPFWAAIVGLSFMARSKVVCWVGLLVANAVAAGLVHLVAR